MSGGIRNKDRNRKVTCLSGMLGARRCYGPRAFMVYRDPESKGTPVCAKCHPLYIAFLEKRGYYIFGIETAPAPVDK